MIRKLEQYEISLNRCKRQYGCRKSIISVRVENLDDGRIRLLLIWYAFGR